MSHQIKQVSPGRAIKVRDDSAKGQKISEGNCGVLKYSKKSDIFLNGLKWFK
jgi:hypothetical protein